jgi:3-dehydroquinate dehydratase
LIPAGATLTPAPSSLNSQSIHVADLLATGAAPNVSVHVPTGKARVLFRRSGLTDGSWTSDDGKVDLLTRLIRPVT